MFISKDEVFVSHSNCLELHVQPFRSEAVEATQDVLKGPRAKYKQTVSNKHSTQSSQAQPLLKDQNSDDFKGSTKRKRCTFNQRQIE